MARFRPTGSVSVLDEFALAFCSKPELLQELQSVSFLLDDSAPYGEPDLLGLYIGLTNAEDSLMQLPLLVKIYLLPLLNKVSSDFLGPIEPDPERLLEEISITVCHELADHFSMYHESIEALGLS